VLEKPVVGTFAQEKDVLWDFSIPCSDITPTFGDQCSLPGLTDGFEYDLRQLGWIIDNYRTKADVYWRFACFEKSVEVVRWLVINIAR
jgi:hypothetical protein